MQSKIDVGQRINLFCMKVCWAVRLSCISDMHINRQSFRTQTASAKREVLCQYRGVLDSLILLLLTCVFQ